LVCGCVWCVWVCVCVCVRERERERMGLKHATTRKHSQIDKILFEREIGIGINLNNNNNNPSRVRP